MALPSLKSGTVVSSPMPQKSRSIPGTPNSNEKEKSTGPFLQPSHGQPSFHPTKSKSAGTASKGSGQSDSKVPKPPKPPDKPLMPYMRYSRKVIGKVWEQVKAQNPDVKLWEIGKIIGQMWRDLSDADKQEFQDGYDTEKAQYAEALKAYHNSPAYLAWVAAKAEKEAMDEEEPVSRTERPPPPTTHKASSKEASRVNILPTDIDDDLDDGFAAKHIAQARYLRNHRLINDIFSDSIVPDVRNIVTETRMSVLKRQVQSLTMHQRKLEGELHEIEEKHTEKKRKFMESSETFQWEMKRVCENKPQISEEMFNSMVARAVKEEMRIRQQQFLVQQQEEGRQRQQQPEQLSQEETTAQESGQESEEVKASQEDSKPAKEPATVVKENEPESMETDHENCPDMSVPPSTEEIGTAEPLMGDSPRQSPSQTKGNDLPNESSTKTEEGLNQTEGSAEKIESSHSQSNSSLARQKSTSDSLDDRTSAESNEKSEEKSD